MINEEKLNIFIRYKLILFNNLKKKNKKKK